MSFLMLYSTKEETVFSYDFKPSDIHKQYWCEAGKPVENHSISSMDGHIHQLSLGLNCEHKQDFRGQKIFSKLLKYLTNFFFFFWVMVSLEL